MNQNFPRFSPCETGWRKTRKSLIYYKKNSCRNKSFYRVAKQNRLPCSFLPTRIEIDPSPPPFFVVTFDAFKKGAQKLSLLNLSKRDVIISTTFFKNILQRSLKVSLLLFADLFKAAFPIAWS